MWWFGGVVRSPAFDRLSCQAAMDAHIKGLTDASKGTLRALADAYGLATEGNKRVLARRIFEHAAHEDCGRRRWR